MKRVKGKLNKKKTMLDIAISISRYIRFIKVQPESMCGFHGLINISEWIYTKQFPFQIYRLDCDYKLF